MRDHFMIRGIQGIAKDILGPPDRLFFDIKQ